MKSIPKQLFWKFMNLLYYGVVLSKHFNGTHSKYNGTHARHFNGSFIHNRKHSKHRNGFFNLTAIDGESSLSAQKLNENSYCLRPWPSLELFIPVSFGHNGLINYVLILNSTLNRTNV